MRPYRAIPIGGKDFVYGWYCYHENKDWICDWDKGFPTKLPDGEIGNTWMVEVIPETVGQQIGKQDSENIEIYKGDIIEWYDACRPKGTDPMKRQVVKWNRWLCGYENCFSGGNVIGNVHQPRIIGTIHDQEQE